MQFAFERRTLQLWVVTVATLVAFAANSVLGRAALFPGGSGAPSIDPISFTVVRLLAGATLLFLLILGNRWKKGEMEIRGSWLASSALMIYAAAFSWSYLSLSAGTGALILFGFVQATMYGWAVWSGERLRLGTWLGLAVASLGLITLSAPGIEKPPLLGGVLMAVAGIAWGGYSLLGRGQSQPVLATAGNFLRCGPLMLLLIPWVVTRGVYTNRGLLLAVISGALTSGLGYVLWYTALKNLTATRAALVQLSVPVLAALGGVLFLGEFFSLRLAIATLLVLGGSGLAIVQKD